MIVHFLKGYGRIEEIPDVLNIVLEFCLCDFGRPGLFAMRQIS